MKREWVRIAGISKLYIIAFGTILAAGCAIHSHPPLAHYPPSPATIEVFYATDREPTGISAKSVGNAQRNTEPVSFGRGRTSAGQVFTGVGTRCVPGSHKIGQTFPARSCLETSAPPTRGLSVLSFNGSGDEEFFQALAKELDRAKRRELLVFIHGYDFRFNEAISQAAQLKRDLEFEGVLILYSWPSRGRRLSYRADETNVKWSREHLRYFLQELTARSAGARLHLIAHSMGNQALLYALNDLATPQGPPGSPRFGQIILAAPDIDADEFRTLAPPILRLADGVTLYLCSKDRALNLSARLHDGRPRAGDAKHDLIVMKGLDTVDVTPADRGRAHHSYFANNRIVLADISRILKDGSRPSERYGVERIELDDGVLWQIRP